MVKKKVSKKKISYNNKTIVIGVIVLVILFVFAFAYQGSREDEEGLGTEGFLAPLVDLFYNFVGKGKDKTPQPNEDKGKDKPPKPQDTCCVYSLCKGNEIKTETMEGLSACNKKQLNNKNIPEAGWEFCAKPKFIDMPEGHDCKILIENECSVNTEPPSNRIVAKSAILGGVDFQYDSDNPEEECTLKWANVNKKDMIKDAEDLCITRAKEKIEDVNLNCKEGCEVGYKTYNELWVRQTIFAPFNPVCNFGGPPRCCVRNICIAVAACFNSAKGGDIDMNGDDEMGDDNMDMNE